MNLDFKKFLDESFKQNELPEITTSRIQYPTGFIPLDYSAGSYLTVYDEAEDPLYAYHNVGISQGSVNVLISKSQGGKTSLSLAMAIAIIYPYINEMIKQYQMRHVFQTFPKEKNLWPSFDGMPIIQILDSERTLPLDYVKKIAQMSNNMVKNHVMINPIATDKDVIQCLEQHVRYKAMYMKKVAMPMLDMYGQVVMEYPPTVIIIDSTSQLLMEECDDPSVVKTGKNKSTISSVYDSNVQNTAGARRAKIITALYSQLVNYAAKYNIIIFSINHINKMLPVNGIPVKQYRGLRAGETIGGGEKAIYLANSILRLDVFKNVSATGSTSVNLGDGVTGHIAIASWIKSKTNSRGNTSQLVYTNRMGYDPLLSNLWQMKTDGVLKDSGRSLCIPGRDDCKFTLKNYQEVFADNPDLLSDVYDVARDHYSKYLDNPTTAQENDRKLMEKIRDDIHTDGGSKSDIDDMDDMFASLINS